MVVTDLDGTLLNARQQVSRADWTTLKRLKKTGVVRVIATGRSLYSLRKVIPDDFPVDYVIFSSGLGLIDWPNQRVLFACSLAAAEVSKTVQILLNRQLDFMLHPPVPDNHYFRYYANGRENPDFWDRIQLYETYASPLDPVADHYVAASQIIAIHPDGDALVEAIREELIPLNVVQTTSPLDHRSCWIEIFPPEVSKSATSARLADHLHINATEVLGIGNDYNDLDLLQWCGRSFVVANAPEYLSALFETAASYENSGFSDAVERSGIKLKS